VPSWLYVPTFATRRLHACQHAWAPTSGRWDRGREMSVNFCRNGDFHAIQGSFTCRKAMTRGRRLYFPSKGRRAGDFFAPEKSWWLQSGLNPWTWVPKVSTLPLDYRSRFFVSLAVHLNLFLRRDSQCWHLASKQASHALNVFLNTQHSLSWNFDSFIFNYCLSFLSKEMDFLHFFILSHLHE
jgi:hypothetical protein